jgi:hypothetical protein
VGFPTTVPELFSMSTGELSLHAPSAALSTVKKMKERKTEKLLEALNIKSQGDSEF